MTRFSRLIVHVIHGFSALAVAGSLALGLALCCAGCKSGGSGTQAAKTVPSATQADPAGAAAGQPSPSTPQTPGAAPGSPAPVPGGASAAQAPVPGAPSAPGSPGGAAAVPLVPSGPPAEVVAKVNGQTITRGMLDFMVKNVVGDQAATLPPARHPEVRHKVLDDLIDKELLFQKATSSKVAVADAEVAATITKIKADFPDEKAFNAQLVKDGMDRAGVELMVREGIAIDKFLRATVQPKVKVGPGEEEKFYQDNKERMRHPEQLRASHILLRVEKGAPPEQKQAQKAKADAALARARKGEDFAALAKEYSQDPGSAVRGGDLGYFGKGAMVPAFDAVAWALKPGEISGLVETEYGYHIVKAIEKRPAGFTPLADVKEKIHEFLVNQKVKEDTQRMIGDLRAQAKIDRSL